MPADKYLDSIFGVSIFFSSKFTHSFIHSTNNKVLDMTLWVRAKAVNSEQVRHISHTHRTYVLMGVPDR